MFGASESETERVKDIGWFDMAIMLSSIQHTAVRKPLIQSNISYKFIESINVGISKYMY